MQHNKPDGQKDYEKLVREVSPKSAVIGPLTRAFVVGGIVCCIAQAFSDAGKAWLNMDKTAAGTFASVMLILITVVLTACGIFDRLGKFAGAGTFVPITGFANAITSASMEFRREGLVLGLGAKLFTVAGPVIVWGVTGAVVYGVIYWIWTLIS